jgi:hypothetical protein
MTLFVTSFCSVRSNSGAISPAKVYFELMIRGRCEYVYNAVIWSLLNGRSRCGSELHAHRLVQVVCQTTRKVRILRKDVIVNSSTGYMDIVVTRPVEKGRKTAAG